MVRKRTRGTIRSFAKNQFVGSEEKSNFDQVNNLFFSAFFKLNTNFQFLFNFTKSQNAIRSEIFLFFLGSLSKGNKFRFLYLIDLNELD